MAEREKKKGAVQLKEEERLRTARLHEEITSRLVELSLITARTLGKEAPSLSQLRLEQRFHTGEGEPSHSQSVFIKVTQLDSKGNCVGVYEDPPGICRPCEASD
jgi:hypothetical protein